MIKKTAETAAEFNMGIRPLVSVSDRHYLKSILEVKRSAELAHESMNSLGYIEFCQKCGFRERTNIKFPEGKCKNCRAKTDYAGPLWLGELHDSAFLKKMEKLNSKRNYSQKKEIKKMLELLKGETGMPPYYYNIHILSRRFSRGYVPRIEPFIEKLKKKGFMASRTHFSPISIKTNAPYKTLARLLSVHK